MIVFVSFCFLYGLVQILKQIFRKTECDFSLPALPSNGVRIFTITGLFLFIPWLTQNLGALLLKKIPNNIDKILWLALLGEISLTLYILFLLINNRHRITGLTAKTFSLSEIFDSYCQSLPLLTLVTLLWKWMVDGLHRLGFPVAFDQQPIIQLLTHSKPHLSSVFAIGICVILLAPLCEEIFFRGILLRFLHAHTSLRKSLWISSLIFAIVHQHFASFLPLCFLGYWLGRSYIKTKCLWINIGVHALFNGTNLILILAIPEL